MTTVASQITSLPIVYSTVYSGEDKKNIKAPRHWPLCGEFTGTGEFPQRASYAGNVSIWWRHHDKELFNQIGWGGGNSWISLVSFNSLMPRKDGSIIGGIIFKLIFIIE